MMTGGSDCHQKPIMMGTVQIPDWVADQFIVELSYIFFAYSAASLK